MVTRIILTSGTSWTVPADWNSANNVIEAIGGGGGGDNDQGSGGGGEYAAIFNFAASPGTVIPISIGAGGAGAASSMSYSVGTSGGDTTFNTTTLVAKSGKFGGGGINIGTGGTGTVLFDGGTGNLLYNSTAGTGGGGAGGPNGAGGKGGQDAFLTGSVNSLYGGGGGAGGANGTAGGAAGGNTTASALSPGGVGVNGSGSGGRGANAVGVQDGLAGVAGTYWDGTAGPGGGGGGGATDLNTDGSGAAGGLYGAGGGAGAYHFPRANATGGGAGAQGVLVITYGPITAKTTMANVANTTVTGNGLIVTATAAAAFALSPDYYVISSGRKLYFEATVNVLVNSGSTAVGVSVPTAVFSTVEQGGIGCFVNFSNGKVYSNGSNTGIDVGGNLVAADVLGVAIDLANNLIWFRKNGGNWLNSGTANPSTATGGISISTALTALAPSIHLNTSGDKFTFNFGGGTFAYPSPTGFDGDSP